MIKITLCEILNELLKYIFKNPKQIKYVIDPHAVNITTTTTKTNTELDNITG